MAFCIVSHLNFQNAAPTFNVQAKDFDPSGWELALVTTPSSNISSANDRQLVGPSYALYFCFILYSLVVLSIAILLSRPH